MKNTIKNLTSFRELKIKRKLFSNQPSQSGEDGVLLWAIDKIPKENRNGWCCEFGAWDGIHLSNTYFFVVKRGYKSVMIEADPEKYKELQKNYKEFDSVLINTKVGCGENDSLDKILSQTNIPIEFDILSIDIDGDDYFVWKAMSKYKPTIVIIEINLNLKPEIEQINDSAADFKIGITGTSARSMTQLAEKKGYVILAHVGTNMIYVRKEFLNLYYDEPINIEDVFTYENHKHLSIEEMQRAAFWA
jgi:hypothetical protein